MKRYPISTYILAYSWENIDETKTNDGLVELDNGDVVLPISFNDKK